MLLIRSTGRCSGAYIGFMPQKYVLPQLETGELRALLPQHKHYALGVAATTRSQARGNRGRERFIEILQQLHGVD